MVGKRKHGVDRTPPVYSLTESRVAVENGRKTLIYGGNLNGWGIASAD